MLKSFIPYAETGPERRHWEFSCEDVFVTLLSNDWSQLRDYDQSYHQFFRKMTLLIESWSHQFRHERSNEFSTKIRQ